MTVSKLGMPFTAALACSSSGTTHPKFPSDLAKFVFPSTVPDVLAAIDSAPGYECPGRSVLGCEPGPGSTVFSPPDDSPAMSLSMSG